MIPRCRSLRNRYALLSFFSLACLSIRSAFVAVLCCGVLWWPAVPCGGLPLIEGVRHLQAFNFSHKVFTELSTTDTVLSPLTLSNFLGLCLATRKLDQGVQCLVGGFAVCGCCCGLGVLWMVAHICDRAWSLFRFSCC